jgi:putative oxidoreductase
MNVPIKNPTVPATSTAMPGEYCMVCLSQQSYRLLIQAAAYLKSPLLLSIRLYWGWQFFQTGKGKLMHPDKVTEFFQSLHIPFPAFNVYLAGGTECFGGLLLLIGLGSRLISLPLIFVTVIAYLTADIDKVKHIFSDPDKFVTADPFLFMLAAIIVLAFGPGAFSLDRLIGNKLSRKNKTPEA